MATSSSTFSLRNKALKLDTAEDADEHISALLEPSAASSITALDLSGNTLGVPACERIATVLPTLTSLREANIADIFTGRLLSEIPQALDVLLKALLKCERLETINLNDNAFGLNTVEPLRPFLRDCVSLRHLYLNNNGLGPAAGALVAGSLEELAKNKAAAREAGKQSVPDLETVVCGRNRLETGSMAAWSKTFAVHPNIRTVRMVQNGIRQEGIALLLSQGLSHCHELRVLDLQDNTFTSLAAKTLSTVLPTAWLKVKELAIGDCLLSARGGVMLGNVLAQGKNPKIEILRVQFNEIDAKGLKAITTAAQSSTALPRLRRVELNGNKFSEDDPSIEFLQTLLSDRKAEKASEYADVDEDDEEAWGVDELDELEDEDSDEEEEADEEEAETEAEEAKVVKDADAAEAQPGVQDKDKEVDELADALGRTVLK
jgi:Ran GTPase-activating protein 1